MRFASTTVSSPTSGGLISVIPGSNAAFNTQFLVPGGNGQFATETIVATMDAAICFAASIVGTAAAANKAIAELQNPNASGIVLIVYALDLFVPVAMAVNVFLDGTSLAPAGTAFNLKIGSAVSTGKVGGGNQLAPTGSLIYTSPTIAANTQYVIPLPYLCVIPSNHNLQLQGQTVNQAFTANVRFIQLNN